jgi:hypothetical protein
MTGFVVDSGAVLHLARTGAEVRGARSLLAPTLLRSQTLPALHEASRPRRSRTSRATAIRHDAGRGASCCRLRGRLPTRSRRRADGGLTMLTLDVPAVRLEIKRIPSSGQVRRRPRQGFPPNCHVRTGGAVLPPEV